jgi:hypothetical protein
MCLARHARTSPSALSWPVAQRDACRWPPKLSLIMAMGPGGARPIASGARRIAYSPGSVPRGGAPDAQPPKLTAAPDEPRTWEVVAPGRAREPPTLIAPLGRLAGRRLSAGGKRLQFAPGGSEAAIRRAGLGATGLRNVVRFPVARDADARRGWGRASGRFGTRSPCDARQASRTRS